MGADGGGVAMDRRQLLRAGAVMGAWSAPVVQAARAPAWAAVGSGAPQPPPPVPQRFACGGGAEDLVVTATGLVEHGTGPFRSAPGNPGSQSTTSVPQLGLRAQQLSAGADLDLERGACTSRAEVSGLTWDLEPSLLGLHSSAALTPVRITAATLSAAAGTVFEGPSTLLSLVSGLTVVIGGSTALQDSRQEPAAHELAPPGSGVTVSVDLNRRDGLLARALLVRVVVRALEPVLLGGLRRVPSGTVLLDARLVAAQATTSVRLAGP
jgi:hypothetical protein